MLKFTTVNRAVMSGVGTRLCLKVPSNPNHSVSLHYPYTDERNANLRMDQQTFIVFTTSSMATSHRTDGTQTLIWQPRGQTASWGASNTA